jgi:hypothetical protein
MRRADRRPAGGRVRLFLLILIPAVLVTAAGRAEPADIEMMISRDILERFIRQAAPLVFDYEIIPGLSAAELTLDQPALSFETGRPGRIWIEFHVKGGSALVGLTALEQQARTWLDIRFKPDMAALEIRFRGADLKIGRSETINIDHLIDPLYLPLVPSEPVSLGRRRLTVAAAGITTEVTKDGVKIMADYRFQVGD